MKLSRGIKFFGLILIVLVIAGFTYAYAASNTVELTAAGDGAATISGFNVTGVHYNLNATTPSNIDSVTFNISPAANTVKISLDGTATYYTCTGTTSLTCTTTGATVSAANSLRVIASN